MSTLGPELSGAEQDWPAVLCLHPAHLVGLPRPMGCLQGLVEPLGHQHQEASHPVQGLCAVDFRFRDDRLGLGSAGGGRVEGTAVLGMAP